MDPCVAPRDLKGSSVELQRSVDVEWRVHAGVGLSWKKEIPVSVVLCAMHIDAAIKRLVVASRFML